MKIAIDIDEVVVEFLESYLKLYKEEYGKEANRNDFLSYRFWEWLPLTKEEAVDLATLLFDTRFEDIPFVEGVKESLEELSKDNEIIFVTSRPVSIKEKSIDFLKKNFKIDFKIFFSSDFHKSEDNNKASICLREGIPILIEDNEEYSLEAAEKGVKVFVLDKPWNKNAKHGNIRRVYNWKEILEGIKDEQRRLLQTA